MAQGSGSESRAEPNLTPLLDVVLQLLMFFMMCANFVSNQVNENVQLPVMQSARPADKRENDLLFLNLTKDGKLEIPGKEPIPLSDQNAVKVELRKTYNDAKRTLDKDDKEVKTIIVIRADQNIDYKDVFQVMYFCKEVGYRQFRMRAMTEVSTKS
jgi:biopolymer transport protein ExbD